MPSGVNGVPMSFQVDGKQYIAVQSGWGVDAARMQARLNLVRPGAVSGGAAGRLDLGVRCRLGFANGCCAPFAGAQQPLLFGLLERIAPCLGCAMCLRLLAAWLALVTAAVPRVQARRPRRISAQAYPPTTAATTRARFTTGSVWRNRAIPRPRPALASCFTKASA